MTTNLFVIANVKQFRTDGILEFYGLFFRTSWGVGVLNSAIFNSFHNSFEFGTILEGLQNLGGGGLTPLPLGTPLIFPMTSWSHKWAYCSGDLKPNVPINYTNVLCHPV